MPAASSPNFTVLGATGFIGSRLAAHLRHLGETVYAPARRHDQPFVQALHGRPLGHIIYCVGLTAEFRTKPFETVDAHVGLLSQVLQTVDFSSLTYLSSTRVYEHTNHGHEAGEISINPSKPTDLFTLSKLLGESLCLNSSKPCRIVRPSNVFGVNDPSKNFLPSVLREAAAKARVKIMLSPESSKDYVDVDDVVRWLHQIAASATQPIYNLASGRNTANAEIAFELEQQGVHVEFSDGGDTIVFPRIDNSRVAQEFGMPQTNLLKNLPKLFNAEKQNLRHQT